MKRFVAVIILSIVGLNAYAAQCNDAIDNDSDGLVDFGFDLSCTSATDDTEAGTTGTLENGWYNWEPSGDSRIVYVSNGGSDSSDGLSPENAKLTPGAGMSLMRDGFPDWLLFDRTSEWQEGFPQICTSGRSITEPRVYGSYGATGDRATFTRGGYGTGGGGCGPEYVHHNTFVSLHFGNMNRDPLGPDWDSDTASSDNLAGWLRGGDNLFFEDIVHQWGEASYDDSLDGFTLNHIRFHRIHVWDNWDTPGFATGIFICNTGGATVTESFFDHIGHNPTISSPPNVFDHNLYSDVCAGAPLNVFDTIFFRGPAGEQFRNGGSIERNLWDGQAIGFGMQPDNASTIIDNVIMNGESFDHKPGGSGDYAWAYDLQTGTETPVISGNVVANCASVSCSNATAVMAAAAPNTVAYDWAGPLTQEISVPDDTRTLVTYNSTQCGGAATEADFSAKRRAQSRMNWDSCYENKTIVDWVRAGYIAAGAPASAVRVGFGAGAKIRFATPIEF